MKASTFATIYERVKDGIHVAVRRYRSGTDPEFFVAVAYVDYELVDRREFSLETQALTHAKDRFNTLCLHHRIPTSPP